MAVNLFATGAAATATQPTAGQAQYSAPSVTITAPTSEQVFTTGGPSITVSWNYSQPEGQDQEQYRIFLTNDAGTSTIFDSGWILGNTTTYNLNLRDAGLIDSGDGDHTDVSVEVWVRAEATAAPGESGLRPFQLEWGVVTNTITDPLDQALVTEASLDVDWTFASTRSKTQSQWRAVLKSTSTGSVLADSSWTSGTDATYTYLYTLSDGSGYDVIVYVRNSEGVEVASATHQITANLPDATAYDPNPDVGRVYEIGINGEGYMLFDNREGRYGDFQYDRRTVPLVGERLVTSETPFSENIDRYNFATMSDWRGGMGQRFFDRASSDGSAFLDGEQLDLRGDNVIGPWGTDVEIDNTFADMSVVCVVDDRLYAYYDQSGTSSSARLNYLDAVGGPWQTAFDVSTTATPAAVFDLASDGGNWYAACGSDGIFKNNAASSAGAAWSGVDAEICEWAGDRLCVAYPTGGSSTPNSFATLNSSGVEEGGAPRISFPSGYEITDIAAIGNYVYFAVKQNNISSIYAWQIGSSESPFLAYAMPAGEVANRIFGYQGNLFVMSVFVAIGVAAIPNVWRMVQDTGSGVLTPFLIDTNIGSLTGGFAAAGSVVAFAWDHIDGTNDGIGFFDLATGGYWKGLTSSTYDGGTAGDVFAFQALTGMAVAGEGILMQSLFPVGSTAYMDTSIFDGGSTLTKNWDRVIIEGEPLLASQQWKLYYTLDGGETYVELVDARNTTTGVRRIEADLDKASATLGLRLELVPAGLNLGPYINLFQVRYYMLGISDEVVVLPIDCGDAVADLEGRPLRENGPGQGAARARRLQDLVQTRVQFQDIDYADTETQEGFVLEGVQLRKWTLKDRSRGQQGVRQVAICTLRRSQK